MPKPRFDRKFVKKLLKVDGVGAFVEELRLARDVKRCAEAKKELTFCKPVNFNYEKFGFSNMVALLGEISEFLGNEPERASKVAELKNFWLGHKHFISKFYHIK